MKEGALQPKRFVVGTQAGDADDRLIYDDATGKLFFDADGTGAGEKQLIARLSGAPALSAGDFFVTGGGGEDGAPVQPDLVSRAFGADTSFMPLAMGGGRGDMMDALTVLV